MPTEFKLPKLDDAIKRVDVAITAANVEGLTQDWVAIRFALQQLKRLQAQQPEPLDPESFREEFERAAVAMGRGIQRIDSGLFKGNYRDTTTQIAWGLFSSHAVVNQFRNLSSAARTRVELVRGIANHGKRVSEECADTVYRDIFTSMLAELELLTN